MKKKLKGLIKHHGYDVDYVKQEALAYTTPYTANELFSVLQSYAKKHGFSLLFTGEYSSEHSNFEVEYFSGRELVRHLVLLNRADTLKITKRINFYKPTEEETDNANGAKLLRTNMIEDLVFKEYDKNSMFFVFNEKLQSFRPILYDDIIKLSNEIIAKMKKLNEEI